MSELDLGRSLEDVRLEVVRRAKEFGPNDPATLAADIEATRLCLEAKEGLVDMPANILYPDDTAQLWLEKRR
jgi:hypothetical protein